MSGTLRFSRQRLLAAFEHAGCLHLLDALEPVTLALNDVLYEPGETVGSVWFPDDALVSLFHVLADGASTDIALVGNEGMIGIALLTGGVATPFRAVVQAGGSAWRLRGQLLSEAFQTNRKVRDVLLRYTQVLLTQLAQAAVCNRHHAVDQQLCRWLLHALDRVPGRTLDMTQELIATNLGVRREGVTAAARKLQQQNIIDYSRGHITVLDRAQLEAASCECYAVVRNETDRLLPPF